MRAVTQGILLALCLMGSAAQAAIVVGQSAPLTGVAGEYGRHLSEGAKAYFLSLNKQSGGINGEQVKHIVYDDGFDAKRTLDNTRKLIDQDKAVALMGYFGADGTYELLRRSWLEQAGIPLVGLTSGASSVRDAASPYIFNTRAGQQDEVIKLVTQMKRLGIDRFGVLYQDDAFGRDGLKVAQAEAKKAGLSIVATGSYKANTLTVESAAKKLAEANPPAILMISITKPTGAFIKAFRGLGGGAILYHTSTVDFDELVREVGAELAHGLAIAQVYPYPWDNQNKLIREYRTAMAEYASTKTPISYASLEGFIMAKLVAEAIGRAGPSPSRSRVFQALSNLGEVNYGGFRIGYSPTDRAGSRFVELTIINQKGELSR
ncbi:ABC transporter substrate-binding protein [Chitinimonas viridis]|uniref:ABC transporter substrate-binding protein n=1 Tax=Chitinimonas viridis TaxID=664880 RepID=A0ABT8B3D1_9NEIS|nr:ABC transporter substrate-binding protein [Chitinimonas viridis]MDN3576744.1 ABC transporter substrate-binding protein [Chitinimonas viridis]